MKKLVLIPEGCKNDSVKCFIDRLPGIFNDKGETMWNRRNIVKVFDVDGEDGIVVKKFKRPGFLKKILYKFIPHKANKAYHNGLELLSRGILTPVPLACVEIYKCGFIEECYYICKKTELPPIEDQLYRDDWDEDLAKAFAAFVVKLHKAGVLHHDLNDTNVRFKKEEKGYEFIVIDINRMDFYKGIDDIPMKERIDNITKFTNRLKLFECVAREYARLCQLDIETWLPEAIERKRKFDINRYYFKRLIHPFRKNNYKFE